MKKHTFEEAMKRLEEIIELLNNGEIPLEDSLTLYSESARLLDFCQTSIEKAELVIEEAFGNSDKEEVASKDE